MFSIALSPLVFRLTRDCFERERLVQVRIIRNAHLLRFCNLLKCKYNLMGGFRCISDILEWFTKLTRA